MAKPPPPRPCPPPGFGDCFLLRIDYDDASARHILIDFGSTGLPKDDPTVNMARVAEDIAESRGG